MSIPSKEQLKARSKHLSKLLEEKYNVKVSHGHCLELIAQLFGFKDWNTASAAAIEEPVEPSGPDLYTPWLKALTDGYLLSVEQAYSQERFHVGGAMAQHSTEHGTKSVPFTPRVDEQNRRVVLTLPLAREVSSPESDLGLERMKQQYRQRESFFAEKIVGKAQDLPKS